MMRYAIVIVAVLALCTGIAFAQVPPLMSYQGVLTDAGGSALPDGPYDITFRLYPDESTELAIWEESKPVFVTKGIFNVILGETIPLEMPFESMLWLGISVEGEAELAPRIPLVSSPYCFSARTVADTAITTEKIANFSITGEKIAFGHVVRALNGITDEVALIEGSNITITPSGQDLIIAASGGGSGVTGSGTNGQVAVWNGTSSISGDNLLYWDDTNKRLGIGTTGPNARLRVESDEYLTGVFASNHQSDTTEVLRANYLGGGDVNAVAVRGISKAGESRGIGGDFSGGHCGLKAAGQGGNNSLYIYGVWAQASGTTTGFCNRYGVWGLATGPSTGNNIGIYGEGTGQAPTVIGAYGYGYGSDKNIYGVYGECMGTGTGVHCAVYGDPWASTDSVYAGYFNGNLVYTGSFYKLSDRMFKTDLRPVDGALDKILALEPRKYRYDRARKEGVSLPRGEHYGLIAQEVEDVLPELVGDLLHPGKPALRGDAPEIAESFGYKGINYIELIPVLVQAIKEQQETIATNQRTIDELKAEVEKLKNR